MFYIYYFETWNDVEQGQYWPTPNGLNLCIIYSKNNHDYFQIYIAILNAS